MDSASITIRISNKKGLHARAAAKFVKTVEQFEAVITVSKMGDAPAAFEDGGHWTVSGNSILGLMMLGAEPGAELFISAVGPQSREAIAALQKLVEDKFEEEE